MVGKKWRQLYLNNNKKKKEKIIVPRDESENGLRMQWNLRVSNL